MYLTTPTCTYGFRRLDMRFFGWIFSSRRSDLGLENPHVEYRRAEYCQLPGGEWAIKRELTLPASTEQLFLTVRLPKR